MRAVIIAVSLLALTGVSASAQSLDRTACPVGSPCPQQAAPANAASEPAAPVGHRQPKASDLTPDVRHSETTGSGAPDPLGPLPQICKRC